MVFFSDAADVVNNYESQHTSQASDEVDAACNHILSL